MLRDDADLETWLRRHGAQLTGPLRHRLITGGRSNLTYEVSGTAGRRYVLRTPPASGPGTAQTHDGAREFGIVSALAGSGVPVPGVVGLETSGDEWGIPFYVTEFVDGVVLATPDDGARLPEPLRDKASSSIVDALAAIHAVDLEATGLGSIGPGRGYVARQLDRWAARAPKLDERSARTILETHAMLSADVPAEGRPTLIHGDYKFANVMIAPATGAVAAVLDWELATIGDPLTDLGGLLAMWPDPLEAEPLVDSPTSNIGFQTRAQVVSRYADATGIDVRHVDWFHSFALWKIACLLAGVVTRYRAGLMGEDDFDIEAGSALVAQLASRAQELL
ncbi:phosphotransferase family protein [Nocardia miyunensis]|uniref:phosphotransferase family protein n=1 Tax=Nocardia miyunensis TaxID=282684 RepID=UPI000830534A|nr:phosphotransferase family protein [Nocardia miyunensis]